MNRYLPLLLALTVLPGCGKDEEVKKDKSAEVKKEKTDKKKKKKQPTISALAPEDPKTKLGDIPVPADLEEEADRSVAIENLEAELDRLEAEIVGVSE